MLSPAASSNHLKAIKTFLVSFADNFPLLGYPAVMDKKPFLLPTRRYPAAPKKSTMYPSTDVANHCIQVDCAPVSA